MGQDIVTKQVLVLNGSKPRRCLSCGRSDIGRKRYCSIECRQNLRHQLTMRSGLLQALNTRYATFYFSDLQITMDILTYGSKEICSFFYPRTPKRSPGKDFNSMAEILGILWWAEQRRTAKRYLATHHILNLAVRNHVSPEAVKPPTIHTPSFKPAVLNHLNLEKVTLSSDMQKAVKDAYRRQVKIHHPDVGGDAGMFRKVHMAYEDMIQWIKNPNFIKHRGFPDKWLYEGDRNHWYQPAPLHTVGN
ncbi:MAG: J domain-containing protein [Syntrophales bacterium LBB04]|nr:J domain-containing protein [Syntrophales bacterium LBB04]